MIVTSSRVLYFLASVSAIVALSIVYKASFMVLDGRLGMTAGSWVLLAILAILFAMASCLAGFSSLKPMRGFGGWKTSGINAKKTGTICGQRTQNRAIVVLMTTYEVD
jgi:hypothetical protein